MNVQFSVSVLYFSFSNGARTHLTFFLIGLGVLTVKTYNDYISGSISRSKSGGISGKISGKVIGLSNDYFLLKYDFLLNFFMISIGFYLVAS